MNSIRAYILFFFVIFISIGLNAQIMANQSSIYNIDSLRQNFDRTPSFGLYKDNYFIFGVPTNHAPTVKNSNAKKIRFLQNAIDILFNIMYNNNTLRKVDFFLLFF